MTIATPVERVVITGATGYIGTRLAEACVVDADVHALVHAPSDVQQLEALGVAIHRVDGEYTGVASAIAAIDPTSVFHLATHYERLDPADPTDMVEANIAFGTYVLDAVARHTQADVVIAGSHFQLAGDRRRPLTFYALTKQMLVEVAGYLAEARDLRWIQTVLFDVYGPDDPRPKLIPVLGERIAAGTEIALPSPEPLHHFVFVDDAVAALRASLIDLRNGSSGRTVFATSDALRKPSAVADRIAELLDTSADVSPEPYDVRGEVIARPVDGRRPDGWEPTTAFDTGLRATLGIVEPPDNPGVTPATP